MKNPFKNNNKRVVERAVERAQWKASIANLAPEKAVELPGKLLRSWFHDDEDLQSIDIIAAPDGPAVNVIGSIRGPVTDVIIDASRLNLFMKEEVRAVLAPKVTGVVDATISSP